MLSERHYTTVSDLCVHIEPTLTGLEYDSDRHLPRNRHMTLISYMGINYHHRKVNLADITYLTFLSKTPCFKMRYDIPADGVPHCPVVSQDKGSY